MGHKVLITGSSGYLGGSLLHRLSQTDLLAPGSLFALTRNDSQAESVKKYGALPLNLSVKDSEAVSNAILDNKITIVYFLIDAVHAESQESFIRALSELKKRTGHAVHFLHTTGAKQFGSQCGAPTDKPLLDSDPNLYGIQEKQRSHPQATRQPVQTNCRIIDLGETFDVPVYIFCPCMVYGKGEGFGNSISIQTAAVTSAAKAARRVYKVDNDRPAWPVCHLSDTISLYIQILRAILDDKSPPSGKNGYYLASSGRVVWEDIYAAIAKAMHKRGLIDDENIILADDAAKDIMADAINCPQDMVHYQVGGNCTFTSRRGYEIGWRPQLPPEHILETMDDEVELVLADIGKKEERKH